MRENFMESKLFQGINIAADLALISLLWLLCSLPVVTIGLSSAALYHTVDLAVLQGRGSVISVFKRSLAQSWKTALPAGAICLLTGSATFFVAQICITDPRGVLLLPLLACFGMMLLWLAVQLYLYPLIGTFSLTGQQLVEMVLQLIFLHPLKTAALLLVFLGAAAAAAWYPPLLMILPGAYGFFAAKLYQPLFFRYIRVTNAEPLSENDC